MSKQNESPNAAQQPATIPGAANANPFLRNMSEHANVGAVEIESSRAVAEVQASAYLAKKCPRDEAKAYQDIMQACSRKALAESAFYSYPRAGETISGPSIRFAEMLVLYWGNIDYGIVELSNKDGKTEMLAYAWDKERNNRPNQIFTVEHARDTRYGKKTLTDQRDIYELGANLGARRLRSCILKLIPIDVVEAAMERCRQTLRGNTDEPLIDRIRKMLSAFAKFGINQAHIEARAKKKVDEFFVDDLIEYVSIYNSIKDAQTKASEWFEVKEAAQQEAAAALPNFMKKNKESEPNE